MIDHSSARAFHHTFLDNTVPYHHHRRSDPKRSTFPPPQNTFRPTLSFTSNSYCMCSLYNNSIHSGNNKFATASAFQVVICAKGSDRSTRKSIPSSPAPFTRTKKMSNSIAKAPLLVLTQQQQQQQFLHRHQHPHQPHQLTQHPHLLSPSPYGSYSSYTQGSPMLPSGLQQQQQQQRPMQRRSPSNGSSSNHRSNDKHQHYHQQQQQHQFDRHYRPHGQQYYSFSNPTQSMVRRSYHTSNPATVTGRAVGSATAKAVTAEASAVTLSPGDDIAQVSSCSSPPTTGNVSTSTPASPSQDKLSVSRPLSSSTVSYASAVALGAAARVSDAHNNDPEPSPADHCMQEQQPNQQELMLLGREAQSYHPETDSPRLSVEMSLASLRSHVVPGLDMTEFGLKESSDYDTADADDDDKGLFGSDSNDTDSALDADADADADVEADTDDNPAGMDRRSRRKQSMQRLLAKNRTLKSSLAQAKADLVSERHNRAVIDQIYLKIRKDLSSKIDSLRMELDQKTLELEEVRQKSASTSSYKIGYNSSPYSLSSIGGVMLHHSSLTEAQDDYDEFYFDKPSSCSWPKTTADQDSALYHSSVGDQDSSASNETGILEEDIDEYIHEPKVSSLEFIEEELVLKNEKHDDEKEKKVTFLSPVETTATVASSDSSKAANLDRDGYDSDGSDSDNDEAPCTMMEILMKKERSQSPEDDVQDTPADANETFESMAEKFLHQALCAKFTPARTILQLDDLLLKYDATVDRLVGVLSAETMKWWECSRLEAGGPSSGGWGARPATLPETGEAVTAKELIELRFKGIFVPLLLNYVPSHVEQLLLLEKLEQSALTSDRWTRNHVAQLMALYKFDVLEAEAIVEWWQQLKEPAGVFGHGHGLRSLSSKFVAWLEDEDDDSDDDDESDDESDDSEDDEVDEDEEEKEEEKDTQRESVNGNVIVGLDSIKKRRAEEIVLGNKRSELETLRQLDCDLKEDEELMVIRSDDGIDDEADERASTTCLLERIEETDRERRISFSTNNVIISREEAARAYLDQCVEDREKEQSTDGQDEDGDVDEEEGSSE